MVGTVKRARLRELLRQYSGMDDADESEGIREEEAGQHEEEDMLVVR